MNTPSFKVEPDIKTSASLGSDQYSGIPWLAAVLLLTFLGLCMVHLIFGDVSHDEGWYLLASRLVYQGQMPYRDFAYFQAPVLPYIYGLWQLIWGPGVVAGRLLTVLLGLGSASIAAHLAYRQAGASAAALAALCFASSTFAVKMFTQTWNIPLATALAALGAWLFISAPRDPWRNALAAGALALATAARVSFGLATGWLILAILFVHRDHLRRSLAAIGTAGILSVLCWGPSLLLAPQQTWFHVFAAQLGRREQHLIGSAKLPTGAVLFVTVSLLAVGVGLFLITTSSALLVSRQDLFKSKNAPAALFLGGMALAVYLPNLLPGDLYPSYLVMALPFMAASAGIAATRIQRQLNKTGRLLSVFLLILLLGYGLASSLLYMPTTLSFDNPNLHQLQRLGEYVAKNASVDRPLFTFETQLAVEADFRVEKGMEMSFFSYFPKMSDSDCQHYHLLNDNLLSNLLLSGRSGAVILSEFDVVLLRDPEGQAKGPIPARTEEQLLLLFPELRGRYYLAETVPRYGEWDTNLYLLLPTPAREPSTLPTGAPEPVTLESLSSRARGRWCAGDSGAEHSIWLAP